MKTEKMSFTPAEIQEKTQALMDENVALETFDRGPSREARDLLNEISRVGLMNSYALRTFLSDKNLNAIENDHIIRAIDLWIDSFPASPWNIAAGLVAQVPHMIARDWRRKESAQNSILLLESAMYRLTALQLEADFRWMEETASEGDKKPQDTAAHVLTGCYELGADATRARRQFLNTPPTVEVVIPDEMAWPEAVQNLDHILSDLKMWIEQKTECRLVDLKLVPDGEQRGCF